MEKGKHTTRMIYAACSFLLILLTLLSFFIAPLLRDRAIRKVLGEGAYVTDTARTPWIYVDEGGVATINSEDCLLFDTLIIPDAVNGIAVTSFDMHYDPPPAWVKRVVFPSTLRKMEEFPFHEWTDIEEIVFREGVTDLSKMYIGPKKSLRTLVLPRSVASLRHDVLHGANPDLTVYYGGTEEEWLALGPAAQRISESFAVVYGADVEKLAK